MGASNHSSIESHYERLLFRLRADKTKVETRLAAFEDFVTGLADGSLPWTHADHAAKALLEVIEEESESTPAKRDNPKRCDKDWECGGCGLFLGSGRSPDFGKYPCVCGLRSRPREVPEWSHNHPSRKKSK